MNIIPNIINISNENKDEKTNQENIRNYKNILHSSKNHTFKYFYFYIN